MAQVEDGETGVRGALRAVWRERLREWARSGESQAAYCREQGLNANTFCGWKRRLECREEPRPRDVVGAGTKGTFSRGEAAAARVASRRAGELFQAIAVRSDSPTGSTPATRTGLESTSVVEIVLRNGRILRAGLNAPAESLARWAQALEQ